MRRFIEDQCRGQRPSFPPAACAAAFFSRAESRRRRTRRWGVRRRSARLTNADGPGMGDTVTAMRARLGHQPVAGIGDQRRARRPIPARYSCPPPARAAVPPRGPVHCARDSSPAASRCRSGPAACESGACPRTRSDPLRRRIRTARRVMSSRLPIGVATTYSVPLTRLVSRARSLAARRQQAGINSPSSVRSAEPAFTLPGPTSARTLAPGLISPPVTIDASGCIS